MDDEQKLPTIGEALAQGKTIVLLPCADPDPIDESTLSLLRALENTGCKQPASPSGSSD